MHRSEPFARPRPYWNRTRAQKKHAYIYMKNALRRASEALGGKFISDDWLDGTNTIVWVAFMGLRKPDYFRAAMQTTSEAYKEAIQTVVYAFKHDPEASCDEYFADEAHIKLCSDFNARVAALLHGAFDDDTEATADATGRAEAILADARILAVREWWEKKPEYRWGCGLHASIHIPAFTVANIETFIDRFLSGNCADYEDAQWTSFSSEELPANFINDGPLMSPEYWTQAEVIAAMKQAGNQG